MTKIDVSVESLVWNETSLILQPLMKCKSLLVHGSVLSVFNDTSVAAVLSDIEQEQLHGAGRAS